MGAATKLKFVGLTSPQTQNQAWSAYLIKALDNTDTVDDTYFGNCTLTRTAGTGTLSGQLSLPIEEGVVAVSDTSYDVAEVMTVTVSDDESVLTSDAKQLTIAAPPAQDDPGSLGASGPLFLNI